jgi:hypothetical protein
MASRSACVNAGIDEELSPVRCAPGAPAPRRSPGTKKRPVATKIVDRTASSGESGASSLAARWNKAVLSSLLMNFCS